MRVIRLINGVGKLAQPLMRPKPQSSDQMALNGMRHCLKPIMSSELLIDVVEMIAQCLRADAERLGNTWSILSCRKHP